MESEDYEQHSDGMQITLPPNALVLNLKINLLKELAILLLEEVQSLDVRRSLDLKRGIDMFQELRKFEIELITFALSYTGGHQREAAQLLGIKATTLNAKLKNYGITKKTVPKLESRSIIYRRSEKTSSDGRCAG
jgi:DNA-binding NtrC family response regulator